MYAREGEIGKMPSAFVILSFRMRKFLPFSAAKPCVLDLEKGPVVEACMGILIISRLIQISTNLLIPRPFFTEQEPLQLRKPSR